MANFQSGGAFLPNSDAQFLGQVDFNALSTGASGTTLKFTAVQVTATGATGSTAASAGSGFPALVTATGASGAGINLPTGACVPGAFYVIKNMMTGVLNVYSTGATINGTTGTTAYTITATGNLTAVAFCTNTGAWQIVFNT